MKTSIATALTFPFILAACAAPAEYTPRFNSAEEEACYAKAAAEITNPDQSLRRASGGNFVVVTMINNSVRDVDQSETFNECMAQSESEDPGSLADLGTVNFSGEELVIWNSLTDQAKRDALEFIRQGGTLAAFVAG